MYIQLFVVILLLSLRKLIFLPSSIMVGHNWDWTFPALSTMFKSLNFVSKYTWWSIDLGTVTNLNISHILPDTLVGFVSYLLSPVNVVVFLIGLLIIISFFSFKKLLDYLIKFSADNYLASFLYAFSPFLFNEIIGGSWYMWISFAAAPIYFLTHLKFIKSRKNSDLLLFLLSSIFVISSLQNFVLIELVFILYLILFKIVNLENYKYLLLSYLLLTLLNTYWLLPFILSMGSFGKTISSVAFTGQFVSAKNSTQNILSLMNLVGYLDRNIYYYAIPFFMLPLFWLSVYLFWSVIFATISNIKKNKSILLWTIIFLGLVFVAKGGNQPLGNLTMWIYKVFPIMSLYRSPQHLVLACAFIIPILISYVVLTLKSKYVKILALILIIVWISGWWLNGDLGEMTLNKDGRDSINFYSLSPELKTLYSLSESDSEVHRIISLPTVISPFYVDNKMQKVGAGGQPEYLYLLNSTYTAENNKIANSVDNYFCEPNKNNINFKDSLSRTNTRYIIIRRDILPQHTNCLHKWNLESVYKEFQNNDSYTQVSSTSGEIIYKLSDKYFLPRIYLTNSKNDILKTNFTRVNPTKYKVKVSGLKDSVQLIFLENFNKQWKILPNNYSFKFLSESTHDEVEGYANRWFIDPKEMCTKNFYCNFNKDGTVDIEFNIEFVTQRYFYIGSIFTLIFIVFGLVIISTKFKK